MRVFIAYCMFFNPGRKMATGFTNITGITSRTNKQLYVLFNILRMLCCDKIGQNDKIGQKWEVESFSFSCDFKHKTQQRLKSAHKK